jgi:60 kDa SS-A/Ro ribonucleoprotein
MFVYSSHYNPNVTPQTEKADARQVENNECGFVFQIDDFKRLERFLILGTEGGTYYAAEKKLTRDNAKCVERCLSADPKRAVDAIVDVSEKGRAAKNDAAIFALALAITIPESSKLASAAIPRVCRTATHLFQFTEIASSFRGWGTNLRNGIASWYEQKDERSLMYQLAKYQQRNGMTHARVIRMAHPNLGDNSIARWALGKDTGERKIDEKRTYQASGALPDYLVAFDELKHCDERRTIELIEQYKFTHEMIATGHRGSAKVWEALLPTMPLGALVRNLGKLSSVGLTGPMSVTERAIADKLSNQDTLVKARIHPINVLSALRVYQKGQGDKGSLTWTPSRLIVDSLDEAFYLAFGAVEPSSKRTMLALDVSGSMSWPQNGSPSLGLTAAELSAALAMVTARIEKQWCVVAFSHQLVQVDISPKMRLADVQRALSSISMGGTDCSLPIVTALKDKIPVDVFHVYTDNETHSGSIHPYQAIQQYRKATGINAKLAVVAMTPTEFSIAHPYDNGMIDVCGADASLPNLLAEFSKW